MASMTPCREYQGRRNKAGYGLRTGSAVKRFGTQYVHRQIMAMAGHEIEGKVVMHLCDNPACFRYDHLRVGTMAENNADRDAKGRGNTWHRGKTHCVHGHEFTPENTYLMSNGGRQCRACKKRNRQSGVTR